jgi:hypothetical protein
MVELGSRSRGTVLTTAHAANLPLSSLTGAQLSLTNNQQRWQLPGDGHTLSRRAAGATKRIKEVPLVDACSSGAPQHRWVESMKQQWAKQPCLRWIQAVGTQTTWQYCSSLSATPPCSYGSPRTGWLPMACMKESGVMTFAGGQVM